MPQRLDELLQECTVKITVPDQSGWGTGFFVAPGLILTCAHVVKRSPGQVQVGWQNKTLDAVVERSIPDPYDLALLRVTLEADANLPCVWLDEDVQPRDPVYLFGYPDEGDRQGEPRTFNCDGITGSDVAAILFNLGQVRPGMSGSPLLNQRTGKVCGMVKFTRDRSIDLGGGAIPSRVILEQFPQLGQLQQKFHQGDRRWRDCASEIDFEPYLKAILDDDDYREWQEVYTPTTVEDRRRMPAQDAATVSQRRFSSRLKLRVETVKLDKQGQGNQPDGTPEPQEQVEQWDVLAGLRNYAAEHVVLTGKPGSGKSTSLERLLWEEAENALDDPTARIPVLVKLRRCTGTIEGLIRDFLVGHQVALEIAQVEELLRQGKFLLLLDGLNELPKAFETEVANFRDRYRRTTPMIVSTRDLGGGGTLGIEKKLKMQPLTEPQMREFVRGYLAEEGDQLFQQLSSDHLRKFAETPLLLFMLCWVFDKNGHVPSNLGLAFREFTQLHDKKIQEDAPAESKDQWPKLLRHLAFALMNSKEPVELRLSMPREEAESLLTDVLQKEGRSNARENAERWLQDLLDYHLIQQVTQSNLEEHIEFRHQLIQEYYAAEHLLRLLPELSDDQLKRDYLNLLKWTESLLMISALASSKDTVKRLINLSLEVHVFLSAKFLEIANPLNLPLIFECINHEISLASIKFWLAGKANFLDEPINLLKIASEKDNINRDAALVGLLELSPENMSEEIYETLKDGECVNSPDTSNPKKTTTKISELAKIISARESRMSAREKLYDFSLGGDRLVAYVIEHCWKLCKPLSTLLIVKIMLEMWNHPYKKEHLEEFKACLKQIGIVNNKALYEGVFEYIKDKERHLKDVFANLMSLMELDSIQSINFSTTSLIFYLAIISPKERFFELDENDGLRELTSLRFIQALFEHSLSERRFTRYMFEFIEYIQAKYGFYNYEIVKGIIPSGASISLFFSYASADEALQAQLANHLTMLERQDIITGWSSYQILPGDDRTQTIHQQLNTADIILLLISPDAIADDTCYHLEIQRAMERHQSGEARVIPILLRPVDWQGAPFSQLDVLPKNHQPVTTWPNQDEAFQEIAAGIREIALELRRNTPAAG